MTIQRVRRSGGQNRGPAAGRAAPCRDWQDWRWQVRHSVRDPAALARLGWMPGPAGARWLALLCRYPLRITPYYLALADPSDPCDPILRQCVPAVREADPAPADPLGERRHQAAFGLVRRYRDRALALVTSECAVYCRHCTRKNFWRSARPVPTRAHLDALVRAVARLPDVREVIVSGGDPLMLSDARLDAFLGALRAIPHVKVLRLATRAPAVLPMRITPELCARLARHRPLWVNTQFNHPRELTPDAARACDRLVRAGLPVSNQTVLLRGVNDSADTLAALCAGLQELSVRPYYLFQCDPVRGARHFSVPIPDGLRLVRALRDRLGGLCQPQYVMDLPGGAGKVPLQPWAIVRLSARRAVLRGPDGNRVDWRYR